MPIKLLTTRYRRPIRAWVLQLLKALVLLVLPMALAAQVQTQAQGVLRVLAWPGYADPDLVKVFEQRTGSTVEITVIDTDEAMWRKLGENKASDFDVFAVNTAELQRYIRAGLVVPINTKAISNASRQLPRFRNLKAIPGLVHGDKAFAIPYTYSEMGLIYDRQQVKEPPTSVRALWDAKYRGKVLLYSGGTHNFSLAAQVMGDTTPFRIDDHAWPAAVDKLIALRRNAQGFYTQPEDSVEQFVSGHTALMFANYGSQQFKLLKAAGVDVGYAIVNEGALSWLDCWAITRSAKNTALAEAWINYFLEAEPGNALLSRQGLANTTSESPYLRPQDRVKWLEPVESEDRRSLMWARILAGDAAKKVLAP